jgi:di/tricarboxylate transporter
MLEFEQLLILAVVLGAMILFMINKLRVDLVALCVLAVLLVSGIIEPEQALYGFANPATGTVAAMFVLSAGLARTGFVEWLARSIDRIAGKSPQQLVFILCVTIGLLSAFIVNTATVAIFIPVAISLANSRKISPSRVLIPLSYASQFGGVCTLVGTSTNILVNSIAVSNGLPRFGLFEFAPLGLIMSGVGIVFLVLVAGWLLPKRKGEYQKLDKYRLVDYLIELRVSEKSPLIGSNWKESKSKDSHQIEMIKLIRSGTKTWHSGNTKIKKGDILLLHGNMEKLMQIKDEYKLESTDTKLNDQQLSSDHVRLIEALVPPDSILVGRTLKTASFYRRFRCRVFAVQRRGKTIRDRIAEMKFQEGDTMLLQCDKEDMEGILSSDDLIVTNELTDLHLRKNRVFIAVGIMVGVVALAALNVFPILVAAIIGAVGMVLSRCISLEEAYKAINWKVIFLLGGILPLGIALQESGTAELLVDSFLQPLVKFGPVIILALLYLITALMTETMSNNAAAILLAPIAFSIAESLGTSPRPFLIAITFAASTSFATPIGYQTNTMIYAPGGYRFYDYSKIGIPLNLLFWIIAVLFIPVFWPF